MALTMMLLLVLYTDSNIIVIGIKHTNNIVVHVYVVDNVGVSVAGER